MDDLSFRRLDCCLETDNGVAVVVTPAERARDLRQAPVYVRAGLGGSGTAASPDREQRRRLPHGCTRRPAWPCDLSFAQVYDPFTFIAMLHMEDFLLAPRGEVGAWVRAGHNGLDGSTQSIPRRPPVGGVRPRAEPRRRGGPTVRPGGVVDDLCERAPTLTIGRMPPGTRRAAGPGVWRAGRQRAAVASGVSVGNWCAATLRAA